MRARPPPPPPRSSVALANEKAVISCWSSVGGLSLLKPFASLRLQLRYQLAGLWEAGSWWVRMSVVVVAVVVVQVVVLVVELVVLVVRVVLAVL